MMEYLNFFTLRSIMNASGICRKPSASGGLTMKASAVQREVFQMGLSPRHKGFHYISSAICAALDSGAFGSGAPTPESASPSEQENVDRCMRYAIHYAWDVSAGRIRELFPGAALPPSPVEFIHAMLWELDGSALKGL